MYMLPSDVLKPANPDADSPAMGAVSDQPADEQLAPMPPRLCDCGPMPIRCCDLELRVIGLWYRIEASLVCCHCQQVRQK